MEFSAACPKCTPTASDALPIVLTIISPARPFQWPRKITSLALMVFCCAVQLESIARGGGVGASDFPSVPFLRADMAMQACFPLPQAPASPRQFPLMKMALEGWLKPLSPHSALKVNRAFESELPIKCYAFWP